MRKEKIQVDRLALEGDGVGHLLVAGLENKKVAFVPYALPGEIVNARVLYDKKNHSRWVPLSIVTPAATRVKPRCPHHFKPGDSLACGGCDWQHLAPVFQKKAKVDLLKETLVRLGGISAPPLQPLLSSTHDWRYRNKAQVPVARQNNKLVTGFFAPGSHQIVEFGDCVIQPDLSVQLIQAIKKYAIQSRWNPYDEDLSRGWIRHILIRTNEAGQALLALIVTSERFPDQKKFIEGMRKQFPALISVFLNVQPGRTHVILGPKWIRLWGEEKIEESIAGLRLSYSPGSFFQVNTQAAELLYEEAIRQLDPQETSVVLDLYCGVGALTFLAAKRAKIAIGVEEASSSIRDAKANAIINGISNVKFVEGEVERLLKHPDQIWGDYLKSEDLLVMIDPPRTGCRPEVLQALLRLHPRRIVYVSCNPATLARDIKLISSHYRVTSVVPVDLFPQTSHIESVTRLERI